MIIYLLKMIACSGVFYAFYYFFLRNEKMLIFNRFYLLSALVISFLIPMITITINPPEGYEEVYYISVAQSREDIIITYIEYLSITLFCLVSIWMLFRFVKTLITFRKMVKSHESVSMGNKKIIFLESNTVPHSFLNNIFLNKAEYESGKIEKEVLEHEFAHTNQKHSWDILFIELLQIICWFNPFLYLYKRSIKINHELLADAAVVKKTGDMRSYQEILLHHAVAKPALALASSFYFSITKKRLIMLQKKYNPSMAFLKPLVLLPLIALLIFTLGNKTYAQDVPPPPPPQKTSGKALPKNVQNVKVITRNGEAYAVLTYKNGKTVTEDISSAKQQKNFEKKYNVELPPPPPPPAIAPPTKEENIPPPPSAESNAVKEFTPPKIVKDGDIKITEVTLTKISDEEKENGILQPAGDKSFTPPKIVKDDDIKITEVTIAKISDENTGKKSSNRDKVKQFTPPKIVKDEDNKVTEITLKEANDHKAASPSTKTSTEKRFTPPVIIKDK